MKFIKKVAFISLALSASVAGLTGCKSNAKMPVNFVAVTSNTYDAEVQFGDYDYKFKGKVDQKSNNFTLEAIVQQRHLNAGGGQGQGGWGGWGGMGGSQEEEVDPDAPVIHVESIQIVKEKGGNPGGGGGGMPPFMLSPRNDPFPPGDPSNPGDEDKYEDVSELEIEAGKDETLTVLFTPEDATNQKVEWTTSNKDVATVSDGKITAVNKGTAVITAKSKDNENATDSVTVTVTKVDVTGISLDKNTEAVYINETKELKATIAPANASLNGVTWESSDPTIATVSSGKVTGVKEGTVTITAKSSDNPTITSSAQVEVKIEDLAAHNKTFKGTYTVDSYGYVLKLKNDGNATGDETTVLHVDFNKTEGRHEFYYQVNLEGQQKLVKFQAKDPTFKDRIAKDYKSWDERDSKYIFRAIGTGNNNSVATAYLYMHNDGSAVLNTPSGTERNITIGLTWTFENDVYTVKNGDKTYTSLKSKNSAKPGYAIPMDSYTFIISNSDVKWKKFEVVDFLGEAQATFSGIYTDDTPDKRQTTYNLYLFSDGSAKVYSGWTQSQTGTFTKVGDVYTINMGEGDKAYQSVSQKVGDDTVINIQIQVSKMFSQETETKEIELTLVK